MLGRRKRIAGVAMACALSTLLAALAGCAPDPTPTPPFPLPTAQSTARPTPRLLRPNALVGTRQAELVESLRPAVDGTYCTPAWRESVFPASIALPVEPVSDDLLLEWNSGGTSNYMSRPGANTYGIPASYTIATSEDSTDGSDGTWLEVVSVTDNIARTRAHRFPFAGARWVRMTVTSAIPGPLGNTFVIDEIDLHDASGGTDDTVFFFGDSITAAAFTRCPANQPSFAELVRLDDPARFPAMIDGGIDGVNISYGVEVIDDWLVLNPDFHVWAIGYGTNDAWQKVSPDDFEEQLETLVDRIQTAGRVPVIARIPYAAKGPDDVDVRALNRVIDRVTANNGLQPGPDLYTWFSTHPDELNEDGVHPSDEGSKSINRLWHEALRPFYGEKP